MASVMVQGPCRCRGSLRVPGDKSISHRVVLIALVTKGVSVIEGFLESQDCLGTLNAARQLGAAVSRGDNTIAIRGADGCLRKPPAKIDMGNSGTGLRLLAGVLAAQPFDCLLTGDASLSSRPMRRIADPLRHMGARLELTGPHGGAPIAVHGAALQAITYRLPVASAQVKSCVLLAGLFAEGQTTVIEPLPTRDHTERLLRMAGAPLSDEENRISIEGSAGAPPVLIPQSWRVPGDFSSAAFWIAAAAAGVDSDLKIENVGLNPRRTAFLQWMRRMGAAIDVCPEVAAAGAEPLGHIRVRCAGSLRASETGGAEIPNLIDELPLVAVTGALGEGLTTISDAAELRVKESDRLAVMARNLQTMGVKVSESDDGLRIEGCGGRLRGGCTLESHGDHRIAMAMAVAALSADAPVKIRDVQCTETSYPGFWNAMERMGAHVEYRDCD